jgi:hypothetical protein
MSEIISSLKKDWGTSNQIKIGFDKVSAPVTKQYPQLIDIQGQPLTDAAGNPLLTEEDASLSSFTQAKNSLSLSVNNPPRQAVGVAEQFPDFSEVSTTLLGVERAEQQLSLFSDVSTYGIDNDNWNFYTFDSRRDDPVEWATRQSTPFGSRTETDFVEETDEQALYLRTFPVQFSYPWGPEWDPPGERTGLYNEALYNQFLNFIAIGKILYLKFVTTYPSYAERNFITDRVQITDSSENPLTLSKNDFIVDNNLNLIIDNNAAYYRADYGNRPDLAFNEIEQFLKVFQRIQNNDIKFPTLEEYPDGDYTLSNEYRALRNYINEGNARPGYSSSNEQFGVLESKESFRYQPGRISGFTFGVRLKTDSSSSSSFIEWGAANDTDEYVFQLRGAEFNIIRRSVIELPSELLARQNLRDRDQNLVFPKTVNNNNPVINQDGQTGTHFETVIPRSRFNGDALQGDGPSGYILDFENVTMFKIEFSWYGAIGAKFYAYIPVGNGNARWVLMHTFVIENGMGEPVLRNPNMKFRYLLYSDDASTLRQPSFIYKYGSSYYIDGGDEGTTTLVSQTAPFKAFNEKTPLIGILPKNVLLNQDGVPIKNYKKVFPNKVSVSSTAPARIDVEEIEGSPNGQHFYYAPSLQNTDPNEFTSRTLNLQFDRTRSKLLTVDEGDDFNEAFFDQAKVIADGIYNCYLDPSEITITEANVLRKLGGYTLKNAEVSVETQKLNGSTFVPEFGQAFSARVSNYGVIAASDTPIFANEFKIHFLNPVSRDQGSESNGRHFADFLFTLTNKKPRIRDPEGDLVFGDNNDSIDLFENPFVEYTNTDVSFDFDGREDGETEPGRGSRFEIDYRLPRPKGTMSGDISTIKGEFQVIGYAVESITDEGGGNYKVTFVNNGPEVITQEDVNNGTAEVGIDNQGSGIFYAGTLQQEENEDGKIIFSILINGNPGNIDEIQIKVLRISDDWNLTYYDSDGNDVLSGNRFLTSKPVPFDFQPVYPVFALRDWAQVNSITVEEIEPQSIRSHVPTWKTENSSLVTNGGITGVDSTFSPSAFVEENRLSSARFDTSTQLPLRPGKQVYSFYVSDNESIDLERIFNFDRKKIIPGLYNNRAYFFTATGLDNSPSKDITLTLTAKEQA